VRELGGHLLNHLDVVLKRTAKVVIGKLVEGPRAAGGAAAIHHDGDETEFSDLLLAIAERRAESFRNEEALRAGVNLFDDGIFLGKIEIRRLPDEAVEISR